MVSSPIEGHESLRILADTIRKKEGQSIILLCDQHGNCVASCTEKSVQEGIRANDLLKHAISIAGGSGGGSPIFAQGRIKDIGQFPKVKESLQTYISGLLKINRSP